jgi:hypothetical protein
MQMGSKSTMILFTSLLIMLQFCGPAEKPARGGAEHITLEGIRSHLKFLSDDLLEGRGTGSRGLELAGKYVAAQFESHGILPGGENGTYYQEVPMVGYTTAPSAIFEFVKGNERIPLRYRDEFVANTARAESRVTLDKEIVFVGYGIDAPEQNWNDYSNMNVRDKILLMTVNDPPSDDPEFFGGKALTYYGRWTYKNEIAGEKGAAGVILIHTTEKSGYPWQVVRNSWSGEQSMLQPKESDPPKTALESWITREAAEQLFNMAGYSLEEMFERAGRRGFQPVPLGVSLAADIRSTIRTFDSQNVVGIVKGQISDEYVLYSSHIDHLGLGTEVNGDGIYNGAQDNGTGSSGLIEIARAFASLPEPPMRSVIFLAVTAEEQGLLGSKYYAQNPIFPLNRTLANVNIDAFHFLGRVKNVIFLGSDRSSLGALGEQEARKSGLTVIPDPSPEQGHFFRSDQLSFVRAGLPAIYINPGLEIEGRPEGWGMEQQDRYREEHYHQPSDEYHDDLNLEGVVQITRLAFEIGLKISAVATWPVWNVGDQFKRIREESLRQK